MRQPYDSTRPLRVEMAFNAASETPFWEDISDLVKGEGVKIARGGGRRHELPPPSRCTVTLDNGTGKFSDFVARFGGINRVPNPAFRATGAAYEVRRNLSTNPWCAVAAGWSPNNVTWTSTRGVAVPAPHPLGITSCCQSTLTAASSATMSLNNMDNLGNSATSRGIGVWVYSPVPVTASCYLGGNQAGTTKNTSVPANTWTYCTSNGASTGFAVVNLFPVSGVGAIGDVCYATGSIAEADITPASYYDGGTTAAAGLTYSWTGTALQSASIATGLPPASTVYAGAERPYVVTGVGVRLPGIRSGSADTYLSLEGDVGGLRMGMQAGKTYTVAAEGNAEAAPTRDHLFPEPRGGRIVVFHRAGAGVYTVLTSDRVPVGSWGRVSLTFALPAGTTEAFVRLYNGDLGSRVDWRNAILSEGATVPDYFDGSTPNTTTYTTRWTGTADASTSEKNILAVQLYRKRIRTVFRDILTAGNLIDAESAAFEGGTVGTWTGTSGAGVANSTTRAYSGTRSMLVTWPTVAANGASAQWSAPAQFVKGRSMTVRARVWVPAGSPPVRLAFVSNFFPFYGAPSTTTGAWEWISATLTPDRPEVFIVLRPNAAATAGQQVWVDEVRIDETAAPATFTTNPLPYSYRFTGKVSTNALIFPNVNRATTQLVATDELAWQGPGFRRFIDVPGQEILSQDPQSLFRLKAGSAADEVSGGTPLALEGTGAAPAAASSAFSGATTAVGTTFSGGRYFSGPLARGIDPYFSNGAVLLAAVRTTSTTVSTIATLRDAYGPKITLAMTATGAVRAFTTAPIFPAYAVSVTSAGTINDGLPHVVQARWTNTGQLSLHVDQLAPVVSAATPAGPQGASDRVTIGGGPGDTSFTGTVMNVAALYNTRTDAELADIAAAMLTGFQGETASARLARYNRWAGGPFATIITTSSTQQVGHFDTEGLGFSDAVEAVSVVEDGLVYVRGDGALVLRGRGTFVGTIVPGFTIPGPTNGDTVNRMRNTLRFETDPREVVNDANGTRPGGAQQRVISSSSILENGRSEATVNGPFVSDAALASVLNWIVSTESTPEPSAEGVSVRMSQLDDAQTAALLAVDLGYVLGWDGLPSQAPAPADTGITLGINETYSLTDLLWEATVTRNPGSDVWIIGDPVYGAIGSTHRISY